MHWLIMLLSCYWQDACEIAFFSCVFYFVALWLKKDHTHNLLLYFYGLISLYASSYILNLNSVFYILTCTWPILATLFIIVHQVTLQRNFVALRHNTYTHDTPCLLWLEILIANSLQLLNRNIPVFCIIERHDSVKELVQTSLTINAPLNRELLNFIYANSSADNNLMIWVSSNGYIKALNCTWKEEIADTHWTSNTVMHTQHTDIIAFCSNPTSNTFTAIIEGNVLSDITGFQLHTLLSKLLRIKRPPLLTNSCDSNIQKKVHRYDNQHKKNTYNQHST